MKNHLRYIVIGLFAILVMNSPVRGQTGDMALGVKIGTLGIGAEMTFGLLLSTIAPGSADHEPPITVLVSSDTANGPADGLSWVLSIAGDGTKITYTSEAADLVVGDTNGAADVFLYDTSSGTTMLITTDTIGGPTNGDSWETSISGDGTKLAFSSIASDLVPGDTNGASDVFLYDTIGGTTTLITTDTLGGATDGDSWAPSISADGTRVAYVSDATDLNVGDTNGVRDVFVFDTISGITLLTSTDTLGGPADDSSSSASISADGSKVAYASNASDLVAGTFVPMCSYMTQIARPPP